MVPRVWTREERIRDTFERTFPRGRHRPQQRCRTGWIDGTVNGIVHPLEAAITVTAIASASAASGGPYTTGSFTRANNRYYVTFCHGYAFSATVGVFTPPTGNTELTSTDGQIFNSSVNRIQAFGFVGDGSSGTWQFTTTNTGVGGSVQVLEIDGHNTSSTVVQAVRASTTGGDPNTWNLTLAALADASNNAVIAGFANAGTGAATPSSGYTEAADIGTGAAALSVNYKVPGTTTPGTTNSNGFADGGGIGIEIAVATAGGTVYDRTASDAFAVSDAAIKSVLRGRTTTDTLLTLDGAFSTVVRGRLLDDSLNLFEQILRQQTFGRVLTDTVQVIDDFIASVSSSVIHQIVLSDSIVTVDQLIKEVQRYRLADDSLAVTDATFTALQRMRELIDSVQLSDGIIRAQLHGRVVADALGVTDSVTATYVPWVEYRYDVKVKLGAQPSGVILGVNDPIRLGTDDRIELGGYN